MLLLWVVFVYYSLCIISLVRVVAETVALGVWNMPWMVS
jgi:hypothetical protein